MTAPTKATNTVRTSPPPAETPRAQKTQPPTTLPTRPRTISPISPYPPPLITNPASQPANNPTTTHETNIPNSMIVLLLGGRGALASASPSRFPLDSVGVSSYITYMSSSIYIIKTAWVFGRPGC